MKGRCISIERNKVILRNEEGTFEAAVTNRNSCTTENPIKPGDIIEIKNDEIHVLTANKTPHSTTNWMNRILNPRRLRAIEMRSRIETGIREFFGSNGFREVRTPLLVPCPGMEPHIRPFKVSDNHYLPTSPEFAMKRLLVGGLEKIFQICPAFRDEPKSVTHNPEFSMLEWYRAYAGYEDIMRDTEELFAFLAVKLFGEPFISFQGRKISVAPPWPRLRVRDLFLEHAGIDLLHTDWPHKTWPHKTWDDIYFEVWLNDIEPKLPKDRAVFVTRYPASQAALAVIDTDPDGSRWAKRFETYAGGLELGNAFEELTDPREQRKRFVEDMELRRRVYGPTFPPNSLDEDFLNALEEGMPPSGGTAMGVDRMVMLFADEPEIDYTLWLDSLGTKP